MLSSGSAMPYSLTLKGGLRSGRDPSWNMHVPCSFIGSPSSLQAVQLSEALHQHAANASITAQGPTHLLTEALWLHAISP